MNKIYIVVGCPGSGKSWVCEQLAAKFDYVPHDSYIGKESVYHSALIFAAKHGSAPVITETPFSLSKITELLEGKGLDVEPVFIQEPKGVIDQRYLKREGKVIPPGHLTRQATYLARARELKAFSGTSSEVLAYLRSADDQ